ncbi:transcription factor 21 isoform X2 [Lutzomyia longipalpis]|uniref:transcription factor 21 isoform X2 n=1 Tax=Lutzomyia longipalpis TaxID=7200 RepID=UPI002483D32A|nr:transcription factor 21 isoform X2 [Lutzomyia longipalpis]
MPRRKRSSSTSCDIFEDDFDEDLDGGNQQQLPIQRNAANARERARMRVLSSAFCRLKTKLPWVPPDTKLSKLDTLRLAKGYIQQLEAILAGEPIEDNLQIASHHNNLTWPFIFQNAYDQRQVLHHANIRQNNGIILNKEQEFHHQDVNVHTGSSLSTNS